MNDNLLGSLLVFDLLVKIPLWLIFSDEAHRSFWKFLGFYFGGFAVIGALVAIVVAICAIGDWIDKWKQRKRSQTPTPETN